METAILNNDMEKVKSLVKSNINFYYKTWRDGHKCVIFYYTVRLGRLDILKFLIETCPIEVYVDYFYMASIACMWGHLHVFKFLNAKFNVLCFSKSLWFEDIKNKCINMMYIACQYNQIDIINFLLEEGATLTEEMILMCNDFYTFKFLFSKIPDIYAKQTREKKLCQPDLDTKIFNFLTST